jgi:uncharacterized membrane protein HdeD (DUF308 family)
MSASPLLIEFDNLRHKWGWLLTLGIVMVILGTIAFFITPAATIGTVIVLGWLLVISGIVELIQTFRMRAWGGIFLHLIGGILGILIGLLVVTHPVAGALAWTLLFASFFTVIGAFRIVAALRLKFPNWGWALFDGLVTLGLGPGLAMARLSPAMRRRVSAISTAKIQSTCINSDPQLNAPIHGRLVGLAEVINVSSTGVGSHPL